MTFARHGAVRPNQHRRPNPPTGAVAPSPALDGPLDAGALLHVQRTAGNAAATVLVQRQPNAPEPGASGSGAPAAGTDRRVLRYGSTGEDVKQLQMKLGRIRERMHDRDPDQNARIDGIFGPLTRQDVIDFQTDTGLDADGVVGPKSWSALDTLVPATPDQGQEVARREQNDAALAMLSAGQYDAALPLFEALLAAAQSPESIGVCAYNIGTCHQQRGRFGLAVTSYERALAGRFNQEGIRQSVLDALMKARNGVFLSEPAPDPEPLPPGADAATTAGREGGGVTERQPAKSGDSGPSVDLFKGKLAHMMVGWKPAMPAGDVFDAPTIERTRQFQEACGLPQSGEADATTWHALDSFTKADVPFSIVHVQNKVAKDDQDMPPEQALPIYQGLRDQARALGLTELVKKREGEIGYFHHELSHFAEAIVHYEIFLGRIFPAPVQYESFLEAVRKARLGLPINP